MSEETLKAASDRYGALLRAKQKLADLEDQMRLLQKHGKGKRWSCRIELEPGDRYRSKRPVEFVAKVPFGVVEQQLAYDIQAARREVYRLSLPVEESRR